jgi:hypothetical protein
MALFERFHLSQEEAEARLKRALTGDPTRGEIGLLAALNANKYDDVQGRLARDTTLGADLRDLVAEHLQKARARWETRKAWSVTLPLPVWDEYARESRITGRSITECLASAVRRDYEQRKGTLEPLETLDQNVRAFHAAATQLLQEARQVLEQLGPINEIGMRLSRIESAVGARSSRRCPCFSGSRAAASTADYRDEPEWVASIQPRSSQACPPSGLAIPRCCSSRRSIGSR